MRPCEAIGPVDARTAAAFARRTGRGPRSGVRAGGLLLWLLAALTFLTLPALAQTDGLILQRDKFRQVEAIDSEVVEAIDRLSNANVVLAERLDAFDPQVATEPVTLESLRQAQFEVSIATTRIETIDQRIQTTTNVLSTQEVRIQNLELSLQQTPENTLERVVIEARLDLAREHRQLLADLLPRLRRYRAVSTEQLALLREQLAIERDRITLSAVDELARIETLPLIIRLRQRVADLNQRNLVLANQAAAIDPTTAEEQRERNLLQIAADEALLRANARLADLDIVAMREALAGFARLVDEPAIPIDLLEDVADYTAQIQSVVSRRLADAAANETARQDLVGIVETTLTGEDGEADDVLTGLQHLAELIALQKGELEQLAETVPPLLSDLNGEIARRSARRLTERDTTRLDREARGRILGEAAELPGKIWRVLEASAYSFGAQVRQAPDGRVALALLAVLAVAVFAVLLRQRFLPRFIANGERRLTALPLEVLRRNVLWLTPAAMWAAATAIFQIPRDTVEIGFAVLLVPAVAGIISTFFDVTLLATRDSRRRHVGAVIKALSVLAVYLIAVVMVAYTVLNDTFVLPSTRSWINRLVFLTFVIGGLPLLLMARYFTIRVRKDPMASTLGYGLAGLALVPPLLLIAIGVLGLVGYTRLATELFVDFATLAGVVAVFALAVAFLRDLLDELVASIRAEDPARAYFVRTNFAGPINRAGQILLAAVALWSVWALFDLTPETPVIREVLAVLSFRLFAAGGTNYTVGSVLLAVVALFAVFWIGGWSRRVSYTVLYRKIRDLGIRQSLSIFTQYVVIVVGLLLTLSAIGFDVTTLTVFAASLGVGIGFGLQNVVNNFISGILILIERPLRIGDIVTVSSQTGTVDAIGIRSLRLKTFDEYDVIVPNSAVISDTFVNWSRTDKVIRQLITVGIAYDDEPQAAVAIVKEIVEGYQPILKTPAPSVTVDEFGDSSVNIRVAYYVELGAAVGIFEIRNHVLTEIWRSFRTAGITIPFPQRDVHIIPAAPAAMAGPAPDERELAEADRLARAYPARRRSAAEPDTAAGPDGHADGEADGR